jgi:predicted nucleic acid-binding protein
VILVDTSVWIRHFRRDDAALATLLDARRVLVHPLVIGELACGNLPRRSEVIGALQQLPHAARASDDEALLFIEQHQLMGRGMSYADVQLLASAVLTDAARIWTLDARLARAASSMSVSFTP